MALNSPLRHEPFYILSPETLSAWIVAPLILNGPVLALAPSFVFNAVANTVLWELPPVLFGPLIWTLGATLKCWACWKGATLNCNNSLNDTAWAVRVERQGGTKPKPLVFIERTWSAMQKKWPKGVFTKDGKRLDKSTVNNKRHKHSEQRVLLVTKHKWQYPEQNPHNDRVWWWLNNRVFWRKQLSLWLSVSWRGYDMVTHSNRNIKL